ncbi:MAG: hypothetical protein ABGZ35_32635 [Planctomycetaceae bacterium]
MIDLLEWRLAGDDPYGDDASTGTQSLPRRRKKKASSKRAAASGGKKSSGSNRGLIIGLSAGGGLLVIALLALAFWPEKPSPEVADASNGDDAAAGINDLEPVSDAPNASTTTHADAVAAIKKLGGKVIPMGTGGPDADSVVSTDGSADSTGTTSDAANPENAGGTQSTSADSSEQIYQFDHDAWSKASEQFRANRINATLVEADDIPGLTDDIPSLTHVALIDLPLPRFGKMPDDLWKKILPVSHIHVRTQYMSGYQMQKLAEHPGLVGLNISRTYVGSGDGLIKLQKHPLFRSLHLSVPMGPISDRQIGELVGLRALGLHHESVSNETVAFITNITELRSLSLQNSSVDDDGISHIVKLTKLQTLFLDGSKVTDAGLKSLENLKSLSLLSVRDLVVSPPAVADLQAALPDCKILK